MGGVAFQPNEKIGVFTVLERRGCRRTPNGTVNAFWLCSCGECEKTKILTTQAIKTYKSCGCKQRERGYKVNGSGRKSKEGTLVEVNTVLSIYKSNARKRNIEFSLSYSAFEKLIVSNCFYCGDAGDNVLRKKDYPEYRYTGIDRIDNDKGYILSNAVSCCKWCNRAKNKQSANNFIEKCKKICEKQEVLFDAN